MSLWDTAPRAPGFLGYGVEGLGLEVLREYGLCSRAEDFMGFRVQRLAGFTVYRLFFFSRFGLESVLFLLQGFFRTVSFKGLV